MELVNVLLMTSNEIIKDSNFRPSPSVVLNSLAIIC